MNKTEISTLTYMKAGLLGIGLDTYWGQFEGLLNNLNNHREVIRHRIAGLGTEVIDAGMVDNPAKAQEAADLFRRNEVELIFLVVSTYALSSTVLPVARKAAVPVVILNLQPVDQLDYASFNGMADRGRMTGVWLEHCQACSVPELASVFNRAGIRYDIVTGYLDDSVAWEEIGSWCKAGSVVSALSRHRMGILGHYYGGMLDVYSDLTRHAAVFGTHFEMVEMCELKKYRDGLSPSEVSEKKEEFHRIFEVSAECEPSEIDRAARTSAALDRLVERRGLNSLAYYYEGESGNEYENIVTSVIAGNTLLTGRNIPVAGECEVKNAHAMKIMAELGAGGSFSEFYLMDFVDEVVMLGHDGPAHFAIAEGKVKLVPLPVYHGKPGKGLSIQMSVKNGPVTLLSVVEGNDGIFLLVAEGESVAGPVMEIGNTNSRYKFSIGVKEFMDKWSKQGPAHHCAIGTGHQGGVLDKIGRLLGIKVVRIC